MLIPINCRSARINPHLFVADGLEIFFFSRKGVIKFNHYSILLDNIFFSNHSGDYPRDHPISHSGFKIKPARKSAIADFLAGLISALFFPIAVFLFQKL